jgi:hypothetical protein
LSYTIIASSLTQPRFSMAICSLTYRLLSIHSYLSNCSATDATLDTDEWLTLTRRGLSPRKKHRAFLGAITSKVSGPPRTKPLNVTKLLPQRHHHPQNRPDLGGSDSTAELGRAMQHCEPDSASVSQYSYLIASPTLSIILSVL